MNNQVQKDEGQEWVTLREAADRRGVGRDAVYNWVRQGWIESKKTAEVRTAPILVEMGEVRAFVPPAQGWPRGRRRCEVCGRAHETSEHHE